MGFEGVMGMPGYAGLLPNTMLPAGLVLTRDLLLSGNASAVLRGLKAEHLRREVKNKFFIANEIVALERLQPGVRVALVESELARQLSVEKKAEGVVTIGAQGTPPLLCIERPSPDYFIDSQMRSVFSYADLRAERTAEIVSQVVPQTAYFAAVGGLYPERHRYTWELLGVATRFASLICQQAKFILGVPRPMDLSPLVAPVILTPGFTAFPMGHATEAFCAAEILANLESGQKPLVPPRPRQLSAESTSLRTQLHRLAYRIAENRVVAGVHFPVDTIAGMGLGMVMAHFIASAAQGHASAMSGWEFATKRQAAGFDEPRLDAGLGDGDGWKELDYQVALPPDRFPTLKMLWYLASEEWQHAKKGRP